jgi:NRAMP (natural resistance-associated macrophage protein)-like metal ion transporter
MNSKISRAVEIVRGFGPGIITGASDDDPSGIATYSQAGAQFGVGVLWLALFSYPFMCAIQEISARIGRVTGVGIAAAIRKHYPRPVVFAIVVLILIAGIFNLGADLGAMGDAAHMLIGGPAWLDLIALGILSMVLQVFVPYTRYVNYLKWLTLSLLAYVITAFLVHINWAAALRATLVPNFRSFHGSYWAVMVAVLGTTISPYLFFWQASQEAEEVQDRQGEEPLRQAPEQAPAQLQRIRLDTYAGMAASNLVAFFIMLTAASTLHVHNITDIQTSTQAAMALQPLAGQFAYVLFALGILATGLLTVPVLAGSSAYAVGEALQWRVGLEAKPRRAAKFYGTLVVATIVGVALNFVGLNPIRALFIAAVVNGVVAAPVMALIMLLARKRKLMGDFTLPAYLTIGGWLATVAMFAASIAMLAGLR